MAVQLVLVQFPDGTVPATQDLGVPATLVIGQDTYQGTLKMILKAPEEQSLPSSLNITGGSLDIETG